MGALVGWLGYLTTAAAVHGFLTSTRFLDMHTTAFAHTCSCLDVCSAWGAQRSVWVITVLVTHQQWLIAHITPTVLAAQTVFGVAFAILCINQPVNPYEVSCFLM
jgi:hypothetical protein